MLRATNTVATFIPTGFAVSAPDSPRRAVRSNASHVRGVTRARTRRHRLVEQLAVELLSQPFDQILRASTAWRIKRLTAAGRDGRFAGGPGVEPGVAGDPLEPRPEAPARIVLAGPHLLGQLEQDALRDVLGVGLLQIPLSAPAIDPAAVPVGELGPGGQVGGTAGASRVGALVCDSTDSSAAILFRVPAFSDAAGTGGSRKTAR